MAVDEERFGGSRKKFSGGEGRADERVRLLRALGSAELEMVASGSATQDFLLGNRKVGSQVIGVDHRIFHFSGPPGFRMAFDGEEWNGKFGRP